MGISIDGFVALPDGSQPWLGEREDDAARPSRRASGRSRASPPGTSARKSSASRQPGGYVIAYGGAAFARALIRHSLVDEYRLNIQPAALGAGMPIFTELPEPLHLELVEARAFGAGDAGHVYVPRTP